MAYKWEVILTTYYITGGPSSKYNEGGRYANRSPVGELATQVAEAYQEIRWETFLELDRNRREWDNQKI